MNFLKKLFPKKRQQPKTKADDYTLIINSDIELSEEQKYLIASIVKNGIANGDHLTLITTSIMFDAGIMESTAISIDDTNKVINVFI